MTTPALLTALAAAAPQASEPQILDLDGTLFVVLGLFLVLAVVLNQLLWKPYLKVKTERIARVDGYKEEATKAEAMAAERLTRVEAELAEARKLGAGELSLARSEAQAREATLVAEAQASSQRALTEARQKLDQALAAQRASLETRARELGREAAQRVLGRAVS